MTSAEKRHLQVADSSRVTLIEQIAAQKKRVDIETGELERLKDLFRDTHDYDSYEGQGVKITLTRNSVLNKGRAQALIDEFGIEATCNYTFNRAKAVKKIPTERVDACYDEGKKKVTITDVPNV